MNASIGIGVLIVVALLALVGIRVNGTHAEGAPKRRTVLSLGLWTVVAIVGVAVWLIARSQISN